MNSSKYSKALPLIFLLAGGLVIRLLASNIDLMYDNDMQTFQAWAANLFENGTSSFYGGSFTDYPPVYMYVLYVLGGIRALLQLEFLSPSFNLLIKTPAMLCDLALGYFIFRLAEKKLDFHASMLLSAAWIFNPSVILDSAVWGQVDSFYTLLLFAALYLLSQKKQLLSYLVFGAAILTKPQSLFVGPIFLWYAILYMKEQEFSAKAIKCFILNLLAAAGFMLAVSLPFTTDFDFSPIINQYINTLGSYSYASINAYNFFALVGGNWSELTETFLMIPYFVWGAVFIAAILAGSIFALYQDSDKSRMWYIAAALNILVFMFSIKMHERYIYPALFFLLAAYVAKADTHKKESRNILALYAGFSVTLLVNCYDVLRMLANGNSLDMIENTQPVFSFMNVLLAVATVVLFFRLGKPGEVSAPVYKNRKKTIKAVERDGAGETTEPDEPPMMSRMDVFLLLLLISVYSFIAFFNLGDTKSPQTAWQPEPQGYAMIDFGEPVYLERFQFMMGARHDKAFMLYASEDGDDWSFDKQIDEASVFYWTDIPLDITARYFEIVPFEDEYAPGEGLMIQEAAFRGENGVLLKTGSVNPEAAALFDEQGFVPYQADYMNGTYFDEIYHPRTGYEFVNGIRVYENTHPPLGKDLLALSIKIFGMTPFGWRFPGTLTGVLMIPLIYALARYIFRSNNWALFSASIFTFDFMHFAQTRLATIDSYVVFFVIGMYLFMYLFIQRWRRRTLNHSLLLLAICGVFMGCAIAAKWQGIYGAIGLPILFLPEWLAMLKKNKREAFITAGFCVLFFVAVPALIYVLSYIPFAIVNGAKDIQSGIREILQNQITMWDYHSDLESTHPFSSVWWEWPLMLRPIYYYANTISDTVRQGISSFGNPAVWWTGIVATIYAVWRLTKKREYTVIFLLVAYAAQYLPWVLVSRTTYIYHYFPSVPFIVLLVTYMFRRRCNKITVPVAYVSVVIVLFVLFYPVLSGIPFPVSYVYSILKWLPGWVLM